MRAYKGCCLTIAKGIALPLLLFITLSFPAFNSVVQAAGVQGNGVVRGPVQTRAISWHNVNRPVLAFYYMWYKPTDWCLCHMSDLPTSNYNSDYTSTIDRQVSEAANSGITGFVSSWWGQGEETDTNFAQLLARSAILQNSTKQYLASSIYFESDSLALNSESKIITALRYIIANYTNNSYYFHWQNKPVIFFTNPLGNGRTLSMWSDVRRQVDPQNKTLWSAEGVDITMLSVFDDIHLFSAGYWGLLHGNMPAVDQEFSGKVAAYNSQYHTQKIWAAGVEPGYDDTRVPGRKGTYIVPRNNGATFRTSWQAAVASSPSWITITTFNEWFEGAMIEPSIHYGNQYLTLTAQFIHSWRY